MFDEQPDGDPHGECPLEIKILQARIAELEAERDAAIALQQGLSEVQDSLLNEIKSLRVERDALRVDAERYRQLRRGQKWSVINGIGGTLRAEELDAAIDAAIADHKDQPK